AARFSSPLGVRDFLKACSVQKVSEVGIKKLGTTIMTLAETEKLKKHKKSIEWRL
ncbi:MAG: histidinol dehydrogenase, partial [Candidatus Altiarchaeales archaeon]|nr:histidinol dehydrogenase [Candidatus Altiarchaeales archaeon]